GTGQELSRLYRPGRHPRKPARVGGRRGAAGAYGHGRPVRPELPGPAHVRGRVAGCHHRHRLRGPAHSAAGGAVQPGRAPGRHRADLTHVPPAAAGRAGSGRHPTQYARLRSVRRSGALGAGCRRSHQLRGPARHRPAPPAIGAGSAFGQRHGYSARLGPAAGNRRAGSRDHLRRVRSRGAHQSHGSQLRGGPGAGAAVPARRSAMRRGEGPYATENRGHQAAVPVRGASRVWACLLGGAARAEPHGRRYTRSVLIVCALCLLPATARAGGFELAEHGAAGTGMAGAFVAKADDASAVFFNPSGLADQRGLQLYLGTTLITAMPSAQVASGGQQDAATAVQPIPTIYASYGLPHQVTLGVGAFTNFGLSLDWPHDWAGRYLIRSVALTTVTINPTPAWRPLPWLAVGGGIDITPASADLSQAINLVAAEANARFRGNAVGVSGNLGVLATLPQMGVVP